MKRVLGTVAGGLAGRQQILVIRIIRTTRLADAGQVVQGQQWAIDRPAAKNLIVVPGRARRFAQVNQLAKPSIGRPIERQPASLAQFRDANTGTDSAPFTRAR